MASKIPTISLLVNSSDSNDSRNERLAIYVDATDVASKKSERFSASPSVFLRGIIVFSALGNRPNRGESPGAVAWCRVRTQS